MPGDKFSKLTWLKRTNGHKFKPAEFRVLVAIFNHTNEHGQRAFPGLKLIAEETGHSKSTVSEAVTALRHAGWITETSKGSGVSGNSSVLALVPDAPNPPSSSSGEEPPTQGSSSPLQEQPVGVVPLEGTSSSPFQEQVVPGAGNPSDPYTRSGSDPDRSDPVEVRHSPNHLEDQDEIGLGSRSLAVAGRTDPWSDPFEVRNHKEPIPEPATERFDWSQYEPGEDQGMSRKARAIRARRPPWSE